MKGYIDLFLLAVPKKNLPAYRKIARMFANVMKDHGALEYREFLGEDLKNNFCLGFPDIYKPKKGEVLISSAVEYSSRKHRDKVNKAVMADPRMQKMMKAKPLFDSKRMVVGGFETFLKM